MTFLSLFLFIEGDVLGCESVILAYPLAVFYLLGEAEELAASAVVEAQSKEDQEEGRAVAGALALEHVRRTFDEPAWVGALAPTAFAGVDEEPEVVLETPKRRRKPRGEPKPEAAEPAAGHYTHRGAHG